MVWLALIGYLIVAWVAYVLPWSVYRLALDYGIPLAAIFCGLALMVGLTFKQGGDG